MNGFFSFFCMYSRAVPIAQLLSQNHDANYLQFWLKSCFVDIKQPDEVIIDASEALISASVQAFTQCASTNQYLTKCMSSLLDNSPPPTCFIRIDRSHFVASILRNKHLQRLGDGVRRLVKGVIGYLIQSDSIKEIERILTKLFTITRNKHVTKETIEAKRFLFDLVRTHIFPEEDFESENKPADDKIE